MDVLVLVVQIITSLATLIVALVLVFQLRKQNDQLKIQHRDSIREANYQIASRFEDVTKETVTDASLTEIWLRGANAWENFIGKARR